MKTNTAILHLVEEIIEGRDSLFESFSFTCVENDLVGFRSGFERISLQDLPVVEDALREGLSTCVGTQISSETSNSKFMRTFRNKPNDSFTGR